ncbi:MAG: hypothetical protein AAF546_07045 [Verrucomicrobiota bacterium]
MKRMLLMISFSRVVLAVSQIAIDTAKDAFQRIPRNECRRIFSATGHHETHQMQARRMTNAVIIRQKLHFEQDMEYLPILFREDQSLMDSGESYSMHVSVGDDGLIEANVIEK